MSHGPEPGIGEEGPRIAVIGSGLAGLTAAWLLGREAHVTVFEQLGRPGMGAHSISVDADGPVVDVPLRVFTPAYYPRLLELYDEAGIRVEGVDYAASFSRPGEGTYFRYRNLRLSNRSIPWIPPSVLLRREPRAIGRDLWRLLRTATGLLRDGRLEGRSLGDWLESEGYGPAFVDRFLLPTYAAICTCSLDSVRRYPADVILAYFCSGVTTVGVMRSEGGSEDVVARLLSRAAEVRTGTPVRSIRPCEGGVEVVEAGGGTARFDHTVLATRADQGAELVEGDPELTDLLSQIPHEESRIVVHRDTSLAPADRRAWRPINLFVSEEHGAPMASIWLNRVQPGLQRRPPLFQTWNPLREPAPESVLTEARVSRPVLTVSTQRVPKQLAALHEDRARRIWPVGSYAEEGIPLLEAAAASAMRVASRLSER